MKYGPLIFLAAFFALAASWFGFVVTPQAQIGLLQQVLTVPTNTGTLYPNSRPGLARQGLDVYRSCGCASCHTQQLGQTNTLASVTLLDVSTNQDRVLAVLTNYLSQALAARPLTGLPKPVLPGTNMEAADSTLKALKAAGAKASLEIFAAGPDIARGWGKRRSVAEDFLYDYPVMLGSQRIGPDLADVGARYADLNWHLRHLYDPQHQVPGSIMPPYRFLFERRKIEQAASPEALMVDKSGYEIVPKPEARALAAYLVSLRAEAPLFVAPLTAPAPATNEVSAGVSPAPASQTNSALNTPK